MTGPDIDQAIVGVHVALSQLLLSARRIAGTHEFVIDERRLQKLRHAVEDLPLPKKDPR